MTPDLSQHISANTVGFKAPNLKSMKDSESLPEAANVDGWTIPGEAPNNLG